MENEYKQTIIYTKCEEMQNKLKAKQNRNRKITSKSAIILLLAVIASVLDIVFIGASLLIKGILTATIITSLGVTLKALSNTIKSENQINSIQKIIEDYKNGEVKAPSMHLKILTNGEIIRRGYTLIKEDFKDEALIRQRFCKNEVPVVIPKSELSKKEHDQNFGEPVLEKHGFEAELIAEDKIKNFIKRDYKRVK